MSPRTNSTHPRKVQTSDVSLHASAGQRSASYDTSLRVTSLRVRNKFNYATFPRQGMHSIKRINHLSYRAREKRVRIYIVDTEPVKIWCVFRGGGEMLRKV